MGCDAVYSSKYLPTCGRDVFHRLPYLRDLLNVSIYLPDYTVSHHRQNIECHCFMFTGCSMAPPISTFYSFQWFHDQKLINWKGFLNKLPLPQQFTVPVREPSVEGKCPVVVTHLLSWKRRPHLKNTKVLEKKYGYGSQQDSKPRINVLARTSGSLTGRPNPVILQSAVDE